jgi:hypothetical protein
MGRILFLSAMAYLAYRYIAKSNKRHEEIATRLGNAEALPPAERELAALAPAQLPSELAAPRSVAAEPDPGV